MPLLSGRSAGDTVRPAGLAPRETEVAHWLVEGKTSPEIATILQTSPRTIHKHIERIFTKLGVQTRTAAVRGILSCQAQAERP